MAPIRVEEREANSMTGWGGSFHQCIIHERSRAGDVMGKGERQGFLPRSQEETRRGVHYCQAHYASPGTERAWHPCPILARMLERGQVSAAKCVIVCLVHAPICCSSQVWPWRRGINRSPIWLMARREMAR